MEQTQALFDSYNKYNDVLEWMFIGQIIFLVIAFIGLVLLVLGFLKKEDDNKRRGVYFIIFGLIIAGCIYLVSQKLQSNVKGALNNTYIIK